MVNSHAPWVSVSGLTIKKRQRVILNDVSFALLQGGSTIVMGPNGAGKTTLLRALHGMEKTGSSTLSWPLPRHEALRQQALVFQTPILLRRNVMENLIYPLLIEGMNRHEAVEKGRELLEEIDLHNHAKRDAKRLSGGEKQKLALARALITKPKLLLLDEPTSNLDGHATGTIETMLHKAKAQGTSIIMATHEIGQAKRLADRVLFFHQGHLLEDSAADMFFKKPQSSEAKAYLNGDIVR